MSKFAMMPERHLTDFDAMAYLVRKCGPVRLLPLGVLMLGASLTEGVGLLLLVPIAQFVTGDAAAQLPQWLRWIGDASLAQLLLAVIALVSLRALIVFAANESRRNLGLRLAQDFREMTHASLVSAEWRWLARQNSGDHAALILGESDRAGSLANCALQMLTALAILLVLAVAALLISPMLALALICLAAPVVALMAVLRSRRAREGEAYGDAYLRLQRLLSDGLKHLRAARIASAEKVLAAEFSAASSRLAELERTYFRIGHRTQMIFQMVAVSLLAVAIYFALGPWGVAPALLVPLLAIAIRAVPLIGSIHQSLRSWRYDKPALARLIEHEREAASHQDRAEEIAALLPFNEAILLQDVMLRYEGRDEPVFENFDLMIEAGSMIGVTGHSGAGKSSLADLLSGLLVPDRGQVLVDGVALEGAHRLQWRRQVGYVEQSPFILDATVAENLAWGRGGVSETEMRAALERAAAQFVFDLPQGLASVMGEGGRRFSGGELQRIALARALLSKPDLLILDEVTAALDRDSSAAILDSVAALKGHCTIVLLSHDREVLARADRVMALGNPK